MGQRGLELGLEGLDVAFKPNETNEYVLALGRGQLRRGRRYGVSEWGRKGGQHSTEVVCSHCRVCSICGSASGHLPPSLCRARRFPRISCRSTPSCPSKTTARPLR